MKTLKIYIHGFVLLLLLQSNMFTQEFLTLDKCKQLAYENNYKLKNVKLQQEAANETRSEAITNYFPTIELDGSAIKSTDKLLTLGLMGMSFSMLDKINVASLTAIQPVFAGGRIINGNKLAGVNVDVHKELVNIEENSLSIDVEESYWQIVSLKNKMKTLNEYESLLNDLLKQVTDGYNSGLITKNDLLKVKLKKSEIELNKLTLQNGIKLAMLAFKQKIGLNDNNQYKLVDTLQILAKPETIYKDPQTAIIDRSEFRLLDLSLKAEELKSSMTFGELLPQVAVGVSGLYMDALDTESRHLVYFGTVRVPISSWWGGYHKLSERSIQEDITKNDIKDKKELLVLQVNKYWNELVESFQKVDLATETLAQAEENLKVNTDSFNQGLVNVSDLLEAKAIQQSSTENLIDAKSDYRIKYINYLNVTGSFK